MQQKTRILAATMIAIVLAGTGLLFVAGCSHGNSSSDVPPGAYKSYPGQKAGPHPGGGNVPPSHS